MKYCVVAKFGKKEHLESLMNGSIFFNSIQSYRNDGTLFRGDSREGGVPFEPNSIRIVNSEGLDLFKDFDIPYPTEVNKFLANDENRIFIFCCASINQNNLTMDNNSNKLKFTREFKEEIKKFGDYVLFFNINELIHKVTTKLKNDYPNFILLNHPINYRDYDSFEVNSDYIKHINLSNDNPLFCYFYKNKNYSLQNEFRLLLINNSDSISQSETNITLDVGELDYKYIYSTEIFLETFECDISHLECDI